MDIKIRLGFRNDGQAGIAWTACVATLCCFFVTATILDVFDEYSGIDLSRNGSNITLPPRPPYCPSRVHARLYRPVLKNGTETAESIMTPRERYVSHVSTMGMLLALIVTISKLFTFTGQDRRLFILGTASLWIVIISVAIQLIRLHDCYHKFVLFVFSLAWIIVFSCLARADQEIRKRWMRRKLRQKIRTMLRTATRRRSYSY